MFYRFITEWSDQPDLCTVNGDSGTPTAEVNTAGTPAAEVQVERKWNTSGIQVGHKWNTTGTCITPDYAI